MKQLKLIRGLPGAGKTTLARQYGVPIEADQFFVVGGSYTFLPYKIGEAHVDAQIRAFNCMNADWNVVVVSNTFSQRWEMAPYLRFAEHFGYAVTIDDLFDAGLTDAELAVRCIHGVPVDKISQMRLRWER